MNQERSRRLVTLTAVLSVIIVGVGGFATLSFSAQPDVATEFYLLTQGSDDEMRAEGYPSRLERMNGSLFVAVENHLETEQRYTLVVQLQQVNRSAENLTVRGRTNLETLRMSVGPKSERVEPVELEDPSNAPGSRVAFLLYRGEPPTDPTISNSYQSTYLWLEG
jgi:uncharacterized membrane protein